MDDFGTMIQLLRFPEETMTSDSESLLSGPCNELLPRRSSPPRIETRHRIQKKGEKEKREGKIGRRRRKGKKGEKGEKGEK